MSERVTSVFLRALELQAAERGAFLSQACAGDPALRNQVDALLADEQAARRWMPDSEPGRRLNGVVAGLGEVLADREGEALPERIGKFPILGLLGRGGMGVVYRSEQEHPRRPIALKLLRPEFLSPASRKRFEYEVEILGRLRHPGIAQIHEAGTVGSGPTLQPYFAMELVEGRPLNEHACGLDVRAKLELVAAVADAVQYAHSQGVVHRDLKPGNVLVDAHSAPRVLDFGIARASDADIQVTTIVTQGGEFLGTLPYMSPEQLSGDAHAVDARADVYALGVNLYLLLAGRLPLELGRRSLTEALTLVRREEPPRLGTLDPTLRGDLETIVHKALAKERERRYQTAAELALDLRRFLAEEPILARPPSAAYQFRKFARRNRTLVAALAVGLLAVVVGLVVALVLYQREKAHAARALSLSILQRLQELRAEAAELWPHVPYDRGNLDAWLERADALAAEIPRLTGFLAELRKEGVQASAGQWTFAADETRWLHGSLVRVHAELAEFADPDPHVGLLAEMRGRHVEAAEREEHGPFWHGFLASYPGNPRYEGLRVEPQAGLVPLREDLRTALWEFWHVESGAKPELDPSSDDWRIEPETGIVLILLPGGTFRMGAQSTDRALPNWDENHRPDTVPVHEVTLGPFFLSKYELTQAQWARFTGQEGDPASRTHPAVNVSMSDLQPGVFDLALPTEAQWEFAARAGTEHTWEFGDEPEPLVLQANLRDHDYRLVDPGVIVPGGDTFTLTAPVGSLDPNGFGFHDLFGNVWEWCWDDYGSYEFPAVGPGALRLVPDTAPNQGHHAFRGGGFRSNFADGNPAARAAAPPATRRPDLGVRLARPLGLP